MAAFSAALVPIVAKLTNVISTLQGATNTDAESIKGWLRIINAFIEDHRSPGGYTTKTWRESINELRNCSLDIENCIDSFSAELMTTKEFAKGIGQSKTRLLETLQLIEAVSSLASQGDAATSSVQKSSGCVEVQKLLDSNKNQTNPAKLDSLLYFCMFPPDLPARSNPLIRIWMAEQLVQTEEVAVEHLETLIKLGIISSVQESNNGKVKRCIPDEKMLKTLSELSMCDSFMLFCDHKAKLRNERPSRLSVYPEGSAISDLDLPGDLSRLRTLVVFPAGESLDGDKDVLDFTKYGLLRVLDVKACAHLNLDEDHLLAICHLRLLKYLSFGGSIDRVPAKIGELKQLETLDLRGSELVTVYADVILLPRLKHLLGKFQISRSNAGIALRFGPELNWKMKDLQENVGKKCRLETLAGFVVNSRKGFAQLMSHIRRLRKATIHCEPDATPKNMEYLSSAITKFIRDGQNTAQSGRSLEVNLSKFSKERSQQFLDSINGGFLSSLKLHAKLTRFPQFVTQLSGIQELCLSSTTLDGKAMMTGLSMLTMLKFLKLVEDNLGPLTIEPQQLLALERLCLVGLISLLDIRIQDGALPRLISLHILCTTLGVLPDINIGSLKSLREVALLSGVGDVAKSSLETSAIDHQNEIKLLLIESP